MWLKKKGGEERDKTVTKLTTGFENETPSDQES